MKQIKIQQKNQREANLAIRIIYSKVVYSPPHTTVHVRNLIQSFTKASLICGIS